jgi:hypothetical protein
MKPRALPPPAPPRLRPVLGAGLQLGAVGALTVVVLDSLVSRVPALNGAPVGRAAARLGLATAAAWATQRAAAPIAVAPGIVTGAVLVTLLDVATMQIGQRRVEPPPGPVGAAWAPLPAYRV